MCNPSSLEKCDGSDMKSWLKSKNVITHAVFYGLYSTDNEIFMIARKSTWHDDIDGDNRIARHTRTDGWGELVIHLGYI